MKTELHGPVVFMQRLVLLLFAVICLSSVIFLIVNEQAANYELEKEIVKISKRIVELNDESRIYLIKIEEYRRPDRVTEYAKNEMNMSLGYSDQIIYVDPSLSKNAQTDTNPSAKEKHQIPN